MTTTRGRPRLRSQRRPGVSARDEILDAAGELFTTRGYASTSTRTIAEAVGVRQASLYHYFRTKDDILSALLHQTVTPSLRFAEQLTEAHQGLPAGGRLHALAVFDGTQLLTGPWNLGALYLLPELREARLASFWLDRERLRLHYLQFSRATRPVDDDTADLPFRLVEALVNMRAAGDHSSPEPLLATRVADACLRVLGVPPEAIDTARAHTARLLPAT
ncbi:TetR/AcrR family transcriptional regulator [Mycolicibacterium tokaiense]|uniref:TetR family transcriptional regulator n=1 Tax=Mycolicibacterium tokaiense TaxID=39695 RepID=A0A378TNW9_9MYCO|nr:TetR/AcrR family transcriptional regulator [Mycolicibacterium tokaiense]BBY89151.1 TetR family transcriptional regulator [Mycolicibacterium tokaiense]STZ62461.1 TetR family transcriptional regulator [Mycolicibacterium tokaiense]